MELTDGKPLDLDVLNFVDFKAAIVTGNLTMRIEMESDYIIKCMRKLQREDIRLIEVKRQRVKGFRKSPRPI